MPGPNIEILLVEDNPADAELTRQALLQAKTSSNLHVVEHGGKALSFLHCEGEYSDAPRPDLILLDIKMPVLDGFGVLKHLRDHPDLSDIPVVVLSSLGEADYIQQTYRLHADAYMRKPVSFDQCVQLVQDICDYWFEMVKLAPRADSPLPDPLTCGNTTAG